MRMGTQAKQLRTFECVSRHTNTNVHKQIEALFASANTFTVVGSPMTLEYPDIFSQ